MLDGLVWGGDQIGLVNTGGLTGQVCEFRWSKQNHNSIQCDANPAEQEQRESERHARFNDPSVR